MVDAMPAVARLQVAPSGPGLSRLVFGTWRLLDDEAGATPEAIVARLEACVDLGVTTIDTAEVYGRYEVEERLGVAFQSRAGLREKLQIVTKCGIYVPVPRHPERTIAHYNTTRERIVKSAEKSLKLLGTDRIDLLLIHRPDWLTPADETAAGLERLLEDGKILSAGVSNYSVAQFETLQSRLSRPLVTNQIELSLLERGPLGDGTLDQCERLRINPMAWSPLGGGRLFGEDEAAVRIRATCEELAPKYGGASIEALAMAWILALPSTPLVVFGTNKLDRIRAAARSAEITLEREDWYRLWQAAAGRRVP